MSSTPPRIISGFGRSGTTWVQDVLAESNHLRPVFEPLHPHQVPGAAAHAHRYVTALDEDPQLYAFLHRFFFEEFHSLWADYRLVRRRLTPSAGDLLSPSRATAFLKYLLVSKDNFLRYRAQRRRPERLVKFVRSNMMLSWIKKNFDARIVFLIRHPAAVVLSQMRSLPSWRPHRNLEIYRKEPRLLERFDRHVKDLVFEDLSEIEGLALSWCIENLVALQQAAESGIPVVHYEILIRDGRPEWDRILAALDLQGVPDETLIRQPSQQTWGTRAESAAELQQYASWMEEIEATTAERIQRILDTTGITTYSLDSALPQGVALAKGREGS